MCFLSLGGSSHGRKFGDIDFDEEDDEDDEDYEIDESDEDTHTEFSNDKEKEKPREKLKVCILFKTWNVHQNKLNHYILWYVWNWIYSN